MGQHEVCLAVETILEPKTEGKRQGKGKNKGGLTGNGRAFLGEAQAHESEMWTEEDGVWWSKENEARKASAFQKLMKAIGKVNFALVHLERIQVVNSTNTKEKERILKEKAREMPIHRQDFQLLKIPLKRDLVLFGNKAVGTPNVLTIPK